MSESLIDTQAAAPDTEPQTDRIQGWRERILRMVLVVILTVGVLMLFFNIRGFLASDNYLFLGFVIFAFVFILIITIRGERTPYKFRAMSVLAVTWGFAILAFQNYGLSGDGRMWLLFFVVFTTIMLGFIPGLIANGISIFTFVTLGFLILSGRLPIQVSAVQDYSLALASWQTTFLTHVFLSLILTFAIGLLLQGLENSIFELQHSINSLSDLSDQLREEHTQFEDRSKDLERRAVQVRTAAEISRSLGTILDTDELLNNVANLMQDRLNLYYVGVFFIDNNRRFAELKAGTGDAGRKMLEEGHRLSVGGSSMVGWTCTHGQPRVALDVGQEAIRFNNPHLPLTRSELALPLQIGSHVIGAFSIQSAQAEAFDDDDIIVMQGIADSLAIALENARLFQQIEESLREIQHLSRQQIDESWVDMVTVEDSQISVETGADISDPAAEINIPLILRGDQVIGNITMETGRSELNPDEQEFLDAISSQAALALESARLLEEANRRVDREQALLNLTTKFAQTLDFETLLKTVVEELGQLPLVTEVSIHIDPPQNILVTPGGGKTILPDEEQFHDQSTEYPEQEL